VGGKGLSDYKQIQEQLKKLSELSPFGMGKSMGPDENTLPGMVVKREMESLGQKITTTLISARKNRLTWRFLKCRRTTPT